MSNSMEKFGWLHIGEPLELRFLEADEKFKLREFFNKKAFRVSDTPLTYRQVNVLDNDSLLGEKRSDSRAWREFSPKEVVYLLIVSELKNFGFEHKKLRTLWEAFFKEPTLDKSKMAIPQLNKGVSEIAIGCVFGQVEITLVASSDGDIAFYDPANYAVHDKHLMSIPTTHIKLNLNHYVNEMLQMMKKKPFPIKWSISDEYIQSAVLDMQPKENKLIEIFRNSEYKTLRIKKKDGDTLVIHAERSSGDKITEDDFAKLLKEKAYQTVTATNRDGKVVSLKVEETIKL